MYKEFTQSELDIISICEDMANLRWNDIIDGNHVQTLEHGFELIINNRKVDAITLLEEYPLEFWFTKYYDKFMYAYFLERTGQGKISPQQYARTFIKVQLKQDYMGACVVDNAQFIASSPYKSMFVKNDGSMAQVCNYAEPGFCGLVDHFDFGQLYPHIYIRALTNESLETAQCLLDLSMMLKNHADKNRAAMRPLVKLMLNSYWGLVSTSNTTFKQYMLTSERRMILECLPFCSGIKLIKTDGVYAQSIDFDGLIKHLATIGDFPIDYERHKPISIVNTGNYIYDGSYVGVRFKNGLTGIPYYGSVSTDRCIKDGRWITRKRDSIADSCYSKYKDLVFSINENGGDEIDN